MAEKPSKSDEGDYPEYIPNEKTGTVLTTSAHIFCAIVGSGILNLPQCVAWLGWVAGPIALVVFFFVALFTSHMLSHCYYWKGVEHGRYHHAVRNILGRKNAIAVSVIQLVYIFLVTVAYTITGASAIKQIAQLSCSYQGKDLDSSSCFSSSTGGVWKATLIFGAAEIILSQSKNIEEVWWMSVVGTIGSFTYAFIALGLSLAHASNGYGNVWGIPIGPAEPDVPGGNTSDVSTADKAFGVLSSMGSLGLAYGFALILLEIQDTLRQPPAAVKSMKFSVNIAVSSAFVLYFVVALAGYAAVGDGVSSLIFDSLPGPRWLLIIAWLAILGHMLTAFQLFIQAMFNSIETNVKWWLLNRAAAEVHITPAPALATVEEAVEGVAPMPSPFDAPHVEKKVTKRKMAGKSMLGYDHIKFEPIEARLSNALSSQLTTRVSTSILVPTSSMKRRTTSGAIGGPSTVGTLGSGATRRHSMFVADTGFANEEVPQNEDGYLVPLQYRLVLRTACVLLSTLIAAIMPFFDAFVALVGSITFFPLSVWFPIICYCKIYNVTGAKKKFYYSIIAVMAAVCGAAAIAAVRGIANGFSTYSVFGLD